MFTHNDKKEDNVKTLAKELELTLDKDEVDELGFPRKRLTETQREFVEKLYKRERGSSDVGIPKSVIFDIVKSHDPFGLKVYEPYAVAATMDTPDNKWWIRWNSWLEEKHRNEEERIKKAEEQAKMIGDAMRPPHNQQQQQQKQQKQQ